MQCCISVASAAGFQCRIEGKGATVTKQALPPRCGSTALLEASVVFPNCWDGKNLDSADHKAHMAYAKNFTCDAAHPVQIPQLTLAERFTKGMTSGTLTLAAMNSPLTLHADFLNSWKPAALATLMQHCIYAHVFCEDVSDTRMPPGMTTTVPAGQTPTGSTTSGTTSGSTTPGSTTPGMPSGSMTEPMPSGSMTAGSATPPSGHATAPTAATSGPVITPVQTSASRLRVVGTGFPAHAAVKISVRLGSHTRHIVAFSGHDGGYTAFVRIPRSWAGTATVTASAGASVQTSATVHVR